jgi:hypothetical protein
VLLDASLVVRPGLEDNAPEAVNQPAATEGNSREQAHALVQAGLTRLADLLQTEERDLQEIPQIGEQAGAVLAAIRAEDERRKIKLGGEDNAAAA